MGRGTNSVMAGAESRNDSELSWRELRSISALARSSVLLQHLGLHNTSKQALLALLFHAWPRFLQEFPPPQSLQHPLQALPWVLGEAKPELC